MMQKFLKSVPFWAVPRMLTSGNIGLGHDIGAFFPVLMALLGPRKNPGWWLHTNLYRNATETS